MTEIKRLEEKIAELEMMVELEQLIMDYLKPKVDAWSINYLAVPVRYVRQYNTSRNSINDWNQELKDYKQLLLIAEMTNESRSKTGESST